MINRYLVVCIASACYFSSEVSAADILNKVRARQQQQAAVQALADEGRALQGLDTLFDAGNDPTRVAGNILSDGVKGQITQVRALQGVGDLMGVADFSVEPYLTTLDAAARTQLGRVHAFHEVKDLATVEDDALNDGQDNEFTTVLDEGLRHQMKGLQMVLKPSSIPDDLYQGQDGMAAGFGTRLRNFLTIATANAITTDQNNAQQHVNELIGAIAATAAGADNGNLADWEAAIQAVYDKAAPTRADYLGLIRGMADDIKHGLAFGSVYLFGPLKAIIHDMLIHFPQ